TAILRDPSLYQLPHQGGRQGIVRLKADRAFAGLEPFELLLECFHCRGIHGIERAVIRGRAEGDQRTPIQAKRSESVTDVFLRFWRDGADGSTKRLEGGPLMAM